MEPATVEEIIKRLQQLPQDLPCYFRPKYSGTIEPWECVSIMVNGISEMEGGNGNNVTFLC